jgi:hypothetical protein
MDNDAYTPWTYVPRLSPLGEGWFAASAGVPVEDCPYTTELDLVESESLAETVLAADRWRAGHLRFQQGQ